MNTKFLNSNNPIKLYRTPLSGHCHRAELMLALLDLPYETIDLDMQNGAHKTSEYLKISPFGQVPAIDDNGFTLSDSNAILIYLEKKYSVDYPWMPKEATKAAEVQRWLSIAAGEIAYGPCTTRLIKLFGVDADYTVAQQKTDHLFSIMETTLQERPFLADTTITMADIAAYSYTAHAPEGGISLDAYPAIKDWLERVESYPGFVAMKRSPLPNG